MRKLYCFICAVFSVVPLSAATNATVTQVQQSYSNDTTLDIDINLNSTPNPTVGGLNGLRGPCGPTETDCYSGAIWSSYNDLKLLNDSTLTVNLTALGTYSGWAAVFFRGLGGNTYSMEGGTFRLNLISYPDAGGNPPIEGVFMTRGAHSDQAVNFIFNSNIIVTATDQFYITRGIFNVNDGKGGYQFNGNTYIDVSQMQPSKGWHGSGVGFKSITSLGESGQFYINYNPATKTTYNPDNIIQLKGDISVELSSKADANAIIHLTNPQSFFQGRFSLQGQANAELLLDRGGKWFLTANSAVRTLNAYNSPSDIENQYGNVEKIAVVDFTKVADDGTDSRLTNGANFGMRMLNIDTLNGNNGVFRLMADVPLGQVDRVNTKAINGLHYIQIYQNGKRLSFDVAGKNMIVAHADQVNGNFIGLATIAGIYDYIPTITPIAGQNGGIDWVLTALDYKPNQTAKTLFNLLSMPYRIFRTQADSINHRIDDLLYPPTQFGAWAKVYGGGIYQKNDFDKNMTSQNLFYSFQGGFDYGENRDDMRYFYGGSFDFLRMYGHDDGYNGTSNSYGLGAYAGYIKDDTIFLDAKFKYIITSFNNTLYQSEEPVDFFGHILMADFRFGYSFFPFRNARKKTTETCKKGSDGMLFCRNDTATGYVRDPSFFIQPYLSLTPGVIFGHHFDFVDVTSRYRVLSRLDTSPALITKLGVLGVKRYEYENFAVRARSFLSYSYDINLGGKITLVDDANIPLYNDAKRGSHRISLGLGTDVLFFNDSLRLFADFSTEFLSRLNTYWLISAGVRYKFGQPPNRRKGSLSYRPKSPAQKRSLRNTLRPYQNVNRAEDSSFRNQNHFNEKSNGFIRPSPRVRR